MKPMNTTPCVRDVVTVTRGTTIAAAAALMRKHHIGALVVTEERRGARVPTGMLTDRDIVVEVVAAGLDARAITVGEIVQRPIVTVAADATRVEIARAMSIHGVRRMPVVDAAGALAGIVTLDDMLIELAAPLVAVGELPARERFYEAGTRTA